MAAGLSPSLTALVHTGLALALAPLLLGVTNRTKAWVAGRQGQPLLQNYFDLAKLLQKGAVYSVTTTWVFRAGPTVSLTAIALALALTPFGGAPAALFFEGDFLLFAGALALARFVTVLAALDTGSSFEGMGASREVQFAALAEPVLLIALAALARIAGSGSLTGMFLGISIGEAGWRVPALAALAVALALVFLTENARIPIDDPNTHLELTMIHEVMVLDHSGPDLAFIHYGAALKYWVLGALVVGVALPVRLEHAWLNTLVGMGGMLAIAIATGLIEATMARLRLLRVPQMLVGGIALCAVALALVLG